MPPLELWQIMSFMDASLNTQVGGFFLKQKIFINLNKQNITKTACLAQKCVMQCRKKLACDRKSRLWKKKKILVVNFYFEPTQNSLSMNDWDDELGKNRPHFFRQPHKPTLKLHPPPPHFGSWFFSNKPTIQVIRVIRANEWICYALKRWSNLKLSSTILHVAHKNKQQQTWHGNDIVVQLFIVQ